MAERKDVAGSASTSPAVAVEVDQWDVMMKWLLAGGARFPDLELRYYSHDYRGVHAARDITNDTCILYVPESHLMTSERAKESDICQALVRANCQLRSAHSYLACYLLQERYKGARSFWKPYIDCLPRDYRNMPIFFDKDELKWLKGSFSREKIDDRHEDLTKEYENLVQHLPNQFNPAKYTYTDFVWARMVVITRIFGMTIKGNATDGLVPMADMLNHRRPGTDTTWTYDDAVSGFTITTTNELVKGVEIYDSYGRKCNSRFFVNYGFALEQNEDNQVVFTLEIPVGDPQYKSKLRFLSQGGGGAARRKFQIPTDYKEKVTREAFSFLRFAYAKDKELLNMSSQYHINVKELDGISLRNELDTLRAFADEAKRVLAGFDSSLEDDNILLADGEKKLTMNQRNCVVMRRGEKEVLQYYIDLFTICTTLSQKPWPEVRSEHNQRVANKLRGPFDHYLTGVFIPLIKSDRDTIVELTANYAGLTV